MPITLYYTEIIVKKDKLKNRQKPVSVQPSPLSLTHQFAKIVKTYSKKEMNLWNI